MKFRKLPVENPVALGVVAGLILLTTMPKVRKKVREYVVRGVASSIGLKHRWDEKFDHNHRDQDISNAVDDKEQENLTDEGEQLRTAPMDDKENLTMDTDDTIDDDTDEVKPNA